MEMAEFGGYDPVIAIVLDRLTDQVFGDMITVTFSRVEQVNAQFLAPTQHAIDFDGAEVTSPFAAELPGSNAYDRYDHVG